jgi:hypothetical protein
MIQLGLTWGVKTTASLSFGTSKKSAVRKLMINVVQAAAW